MGNPTESLKQMTQQMGWIGQFLGDDFWQRIQEGVAAIQVPQGGGAPRNSGSLKKSSPSQDGAAPPVDIMVTPAEIVLYTALPGVASPEQIEVGFAAPNILVLEAFLQPPDPLGITVRQERFTGYCTRTINLPAGAVPAGVVARYADGILELRIPREQTEGNDGVSFLHVPSQ